MGPLDVVGGHILSLGGNDGAAQARVGVRIAAAVLRAMLISLIRRVKILPRLASSAPFLCLIVAHLSGRTWLDLVSKYLLKELWMAQDSPSEEITGLPRFVCRRT